MPLPLTVSCFSKIQIGSTFLVPAHLGSPGKRAVKRMCVCVCVCVVIIDTHWSIIGTEDSVMFVQHFCSEFHPAHYQLDVLCYGAEY